MTPRILSAALLLVAATSAQADLSMGVQVGGPDGEWDYYGDTGMPGFQSATRLGAHAGYNDRGDNPDIEIPGGYFDPGVYKGTTKCGTPGFPCGITDSHAFGDIDASTGRFRGYAGVSTPSFGYYHAYLGATLTDTLLPNASDTFVFDLRLDASHDVDVQVPESSYPGTNFIYTINFRLPDAATPPNCGGEGEPSCDTTFASFQYISGWDTVTEQSVWTWSFLREQRGNFESDSDSGTGTSTSLDFFIWNPLQPFVMEVSTSIQADCVRQGAGNCEASVDAFHSAYLGITGDYVSANGYHYIGTAAIPEPSTLALWLAGLGVGGWLKLRRERR